MRPDIDTPELDPNYMFGWKVLGVTVGAVAVLGVGAVIAFFAAG